MAMPAAVAGEKMGVPKTPMGVGGMAYGTGRIEERTAVRYMAVARAGRRVGPPIRTGVFRGTGGTSGGVARSAEHGRTPVGMHRLPAF